jgi:hypothetical protein
MKFNPTDKSDSIIADIDFLLFGDSSVFNTDYSLADRTRNVNISWDEAVAELYKADPNFSWDDTTNTDFPIATQDLVATQDHYTLLDSALVIHRVRIKNREGRYKTLTPALRRELSDSELEATGTPEKYYKLGSAIFPTPIPDYGATAGVEVEFQRGANHFTTSDTTKEPGFNPQFHQFLSVGAALRYALANGMDKKASHLSAIKEQIRTAIREHYQSRSPDERPKIRLRKRSINSYGL